MKKLSAILLTLVLVMGIFAGCGTTETPESKTPESPAVEAEPTEEVEDTPEEAEEAGTGSDVEGNLIYWTFTDNANNIVKEFNKHYPNIEIDLQVFAGDEYKTKLMTTIQSGAGIPDIFDLEENYSGEFINSDIIADLSDLGFEEKMEDYFSYMVAQTKDKDGKIKGVTFQSSPVCFWYLRDAMEEWMGTSDPEELAEKLNGWDAVKENALRIQEESDGAVQLWPNVIEMVKVDAFGYTPFVRDGVFSVDERWYDLIDTMRDFHENNVTADLNSWSEDWAAKWNAGDLLIRVMPSWDFFTDWDSNDGNVGIMAPFHSSFEGGTLTAMWSETQSEEAALLFLEFLTSEEFQSANFLEYNQVPANGKVAESLEDGYSSEKFGGQNLIKTYSEINNNVADIVPDRYTRAVQNTFQKHANDGVRNGLSNDEIMTGFKEELADKYPEIEGLD